jgi:hypothetical protein
MPLPLLRLATREVQRLLFILPLVIGGENASIIDEDVIDLGEKIHILKQQIVNLKDEK